MRKKGKGKRKDVLKSHETFSNIDWILLYDTLWKFNAIKWVNENLSYNIKKQDFFSSEAIDLGNWWSDLVVLSR